MSQPGGGKAAHARRITHTAAFGTAPPKAGRPREAKDRRERQRQRSPLLIDQLVGMASDALARAIALSGSARDMARELGLPGLPGWHTCVPWYAVRVAAYTGYRVTPHQLRPDIYPYPEDGVPRELRAVVLREHAKLQRAANVGAMSEWHHALIRPPEAADLGGTGSIRFGPHTIEEDVLLGV